MRLLDHEELTRQSLRKRKTAFARRLSDNTRIVLKRFADCWRGAARSESDPDEIAAFEMPAVLVDMIVKDPTSTTQHLRKIIAMCPAYPNHGRGTLTRLANAERNGSLVDVKDERGGLTILTPVDFSLN